MLGSNMALLQRIRCRACRINLVEVLMDSRKRSRKEASWLRQVLGERSEGSSNRHYLFLKIWI